MLTALCLSPEKMRLLQGMQPLVSCSVAGAISGTTSSLVFLLPLFSTFPSSTPLQFFLDRPNSTAPCSSHPPFTLMLRLLQDAAVHSEHRNTLLATVIIYCGYITVIRTCTG